MEEGSYSSRSPNVFHELELIDQTYNHHVQISVSQSVVLLDFVLNLTER